MKVNMSEAIELRLIVTKMINTRTETWTITHERVRLLEYSRICLNLSLINLNIINDMIQSFQGNPELLEWTMTASRVRALYAISQRLGQPIAKDIKYIIDIIKTDNRFSSVRKLPVTLAAIELLEYLYTNLGRLTYNRSDGQEPE